jgi:hypothetical protein
MKYLGTLPFLAPAVLALALGSPLQAAAASGLLERLPMRFEANQGQVNREVRYYSRGPNYTLFLTSQEAVLSLAGGTSTEVLRISLPKGNAQPQIEGIDPLASRTDYFLGNRKAAWRTNVRQYQRVRYREVYPGVDLIFYGNGRQLEYDFVVRPGVDPRRIRMKFTGARKISLDETGALVLRMGEAELRQHKPLAYQGSHREVAARYVLLGRGEVGFSVGKYDPHQALVIDPVLSYSTLLGGSSLEVGTAVATDPAGYIWVAGYTWSQDFPIAGAAYRDYSGGSQDIFLAKFHPAFSGTDSLRYSAYLGGSGDDEVRAMCLGAGGALYLVGTTTSTDFPTAGNAHQTSNAGGTDAFVVQLYPDIPFGDALVFATYLGGTDTDVANALAVDAAGKIYVTGYTTSADNFPLSSVPLQGGSRGGWEAFVSIVDPSLPAADSLWYSTFLGGSSTDVATAVVADGAGNVYIAGYTLSIDFPVTDRPYSDSLIGGGDIFFTKLDLSLPGLEALAYSTFLGGSGLDVPLSMVRDASGGFWLAGYTLSPDFPVTDAAPQPRYAGLADAFVVRFDPALPRTQALTYSTYLGGTGTDVAYGVALNGSGKVYLAGYTTSSDFPVTSGAVQSAYAGGADAFAAVLDPAASAAQALVYGTYLGGTLADVAYGVAVDADGNVYLAGFTQSTPFPVTDSAFQAARNGYGDAFAAMLTMAP